MDDKAIEQKLRVLFDNEVKLVEPSSEWWDKLVSDITKPSRSVLFWEKITTIFPKPLRIALPLALVLITIGALLGKMVLPQLIGSSSITFAPGPSSSGSYISNFQDIGELCNSSDVIVIGTVERIIDIVPAEWGNGTIYNARSAFRVDEVLKGKIAKEIILTKMALKDENGWVEGMNVDPPFEAGEKWVLFLSADMSYNNLGPWGRYKIIDDKVYSMNRIANDNNAYGNEIDVNGVPLREFIAGVNQTLDSIMLTFTNNRIPWAIERAVRFEAGGLQDVNVNLSTGEYGPDLVTYSIKRIESRDSNLEIPIPEGMKITIEPTQLVVNPRNEYRSILRINTTSDVKTDTYWIRVEYSIGKSVSGYRVLMVNVGP